MIDGGELPGTASTVIDLRALRGDGDWTVVREGAVPRERRGATALEGQFHFDPSSYAR